ncbi:hypothetical protein BC834DRAFT_634856 [Gloeopeniophorella convolvens]|nr:hypothetical protein BC834DRAFT_634856 [Gloeopeniophorella convolvens]
MAPCSRAVMQLGKNSTESEFRFGYSALLRNPNGRRPIKKNKLPRWRTRHRRAHSSQKLELFNQTCQSCRTRRQQCAYPSQHVVRGILTEKTMAGPALSIVLYNILDQAIHSSCSTTTLLRIVSWWRYLGETCLSYALNFIVSKEPGQQGTADHTAHAGRVIQLTRRTCRSESDLLAMGPTARRVGAEPSFASKNCGWPGSPLTGARSSNMLRRCAA